MEDHRPYQSGFQIDNFVLAQNGATPWGVYRQSLRELKSRWDSIRLLSAKLKCLKLQKAKLSDTSALIDADQFGLMRIDSTEDPIVEDVRLSIAIEDCEKHLSDTKREFMRFYAHATWYKAHFGSLTEEDIERLEAEEWIAKLKRKVAIEIVVHKQVSEPTLDAVLALEEEHKESLIKFAGESLGDRIGLIAWLKKHSCPLRMAPGTNLEEAKNALQHLNSG